MSTATAAPARLGGLTPRRLFLTLAIAESITWTLLIGGIILRAATDIPTGVAIGGRLHGFVFLAYIATALFVAINQRWGILVTLLAVAAAMIPYATIPVEVWLARSGRLGGAWRRDATDHPHDRRPASRVLRFILRRPLLFGVAAVVVVALVFTALLISGPPGGR